MWASLSEVCSAQSKHLVVFVIIIMVSITTATIVYGKRSDPSAWWKYLNIAIILFSLQKGGYIITLGISRSFSVLKFSPNCLFYYKKRLIQRWPWSAGWNRILHHGNKFLWGHRRRCSEKEDLITLLEDIHLVSLKSSQVLTFQSGARETLMLMLFWGSEAQKCVENTTRKL